MPSTAGIGHILPRFAIDDPNAVVKLLAIWLPSGKVITGLTTITAIHQAMNNKKYTIIFNNIIDAASTEYSTPSILIL
jgi:hypothetical protein